MQEVAVLLKFDKSIGTNLVTICKILRRRHLVRMKNFVLNRTVGMERITNRLVSGYKSEVVSWRLLRDKGGHRKIVFFVRLASSTIFRENRDGIQLASGAFRAATGTYA